MRAARSSLSSTRRTDSSLQPTADALAGAMNRLASDKGLAARLGDAGYDRARLVTWDGVIEKLVQVQRRR